MSQWTKNIPNDWGTETLKDSVSNIVDNRGKTCPTSDVGIPLIATNCVKEFGLYPIFEKLRYIDQKTYNNWFRAHPKANDILFVNKGTPGGVCVVPDPVPFCIAQDMVALRANPERFEWKYLFAALRSSFVRSQIEALNVGTSIPHLKKTDFDRIVIPRPNLKDQKVIGDIYFSISEKIELNLQMNKTLEEMAMASFRQWFIEEIEEEWETISLQSLIEIKGGFSYKGQFIGSGDALLLGMGCVSFGNRFLSSGARQYSGDCSLTHLVVPGDLVIATRQQSDNMPILGYPAIIPVSLDGKKVIVGTNLYRVINNSYFSNNLLFQLLRSTEYRNHILANSKGSTVRMITKDAIELFEFKMPPFELLKKYDEQITGFGVQIEHNMMENQTLTTLRDTLLPKLISGEIRVKNAEQMVAASL